MAGWAKLAKYKQCCLRQAKPQADSGHAKALSKATIWLAERHKPAVQDAINEYFFGGLDDEEIDRIEDLPDEVYGAVMLNAMEWLLADGVIEYQGEAWETSELLLGPGGPALTTDERRWLQSLVGQPLRLYEVLETSPGEGMLLKDVLAPSRPAVYVQEKSGSCYFDPYDLVAVRIVPLNGLHQLSGAVYPIPRASGLDLIAELRDELEGLPSDDPAAKAITGTIIPYHWLELLLFPSEMPELLDATTRDLILLVTDHYRVHDWDALAAALASQPDIEGGRDEGWDRTFEGDDGLPRTSLAINLSKKPDGIEVFYRTQQYADQGRPWLEALAGASIGFLTREIADPKGAMSKAGPDAPKKLSKAIDELPPEAVAQALQQYIHRLYADWADSPLQVLDGKSPREMIGTAEGLERVRFLLRTYEHGEAQQARDQQREPVSYAFLWKELGIER